MKLFVKQDISPGDFYPNNTVIACGKSLSDYGNGWYVKLELPFVRHGWHINTTTLKPALGPERYVIRFRYLPATENRKSIKQLVKGWFPV